MSGSSRSKKTVELRLDGGCALSCMHCDCHGGAELDRARRLAGGGAVVTLAGGTADLDNLRSVVAEVRRAGFREIVVRTSAFFDDPSAAARVFRDIGADRVRVPFHSHAPAAHDAIAQKPGALVHALVGVRALAREGLSVEAEVALFSSRVQNPLEIVRLVHRAVPSLRRVRFFVPRRASLDVLAPESWAVAGPALAAALHYCRTHRIACDIRGEDGIPFCALAHDASLLDVFRFHPRKPAREREGFAKAAACERCAARAQCSGNTLAYHEAHGGRGLTPFLRRPRALYSQRTTPLREWTEREHVAAKRLSLLILRPTVNCNQDCVFCSTNETTRNLWEDRRAMLRAIVRGAQRGVTRVCFSGGEPTLSPHLVEFVHTAKRLGIPEIEICTNAVLLERPARVQSLREAGLTHGWISLHAHNEELSRFSTLKKGDFARTVKGTHLLLDAGCVVVINHVVNSLNYRHLERFVEFVHSEWQGRVSISFAFVTPQYKAAENMSIVPKLSEVAPYLRRALYRALQLGQPFFVGARQGMPPCFLGEFRPWSDILWILDEAVGVDGPQKVRGSRCDSCRYSSVCTGIWRDYAARYGTDELVPVPGEAFTEEQLLELKAAESLRHSPPRSFAEAHPLLREPSLELTEAPPLDKTLTARKALPVLHTRTRPVRVVMAGSRGQSQRLAAALTRVDGIIIDAYASPNAPDAALSHFVSVPRLRSLHEAIDQVRPDAVIIGAATHAHAALATAALDAALPTLLEKPFGGTVAIAEELAADAAQRDVLLVPAHNVRFRPGLDVLTLARPRNVSLVLRVPPFAPDAPTSWDESALFELLYHVFVTVGAATGDVGGRIVDVSWSGQHVPERLRFSIDCEGIPVDVLLDYTASSFELRIDAESDDGRRRSFRQTGTRVAAEVAGAPFPIESGSDTERMLEHFRDLVLERVKPLVVPNHAVTVLRLVADALSALRVASAPFERAHAPRHVASPGVGIRHTLEISAPRKVSSAKRK